MKMRRALPLFFVAFAIGCGPQPSIVGKWRHEWQGDNQGFEIMELAADGTYKGQFEGKLVSRGSHFRESKEGTFAYSNDRLTITQTKWRMETLNPDGSVQKTTESGKSSTKTWSRPILRGDALILSAPDGISTEDAPSTFKRVQ